MVGWKSGSWGFHGDNGKYFEATGRGLPYGPTYSLGDVVGCRFDRDAKSMFFTKKRTICSHKFSQLAKQLRT